MKKLLLTIILLLIPAFVLADSGVVIISGAGIHPTEQNPSKENSVVLDKTSPGLQKNVELSEKEKKIQEFEAKVKPLPASDIEGNLYYYKKLLALDPDNIRYQRKVSYYSKQNAYLKAKPYSPLIIKNSNNYIPTVKQKLWMLATCSVLTESNNGKHDLLGSEPKNIKNTDRARSLLSEWWGIKSREEFMGTLLWLEKSGHRKDFDTLANLISLLSEEDMLSLKKYYSENTFALNRIEIVSEYSHSVGSKSISGWDYSRYISLCGWAYLSDYITEKESWLLIIPVAKTLQRTFSSWEDLGLNYIIGRKYWSKKQTIKRGHLISKAYNKLLYSADSPWLSLPWGLDLNQQLPKDE